MQELRAVNSFPLNIDQGLRKCRDNDTPGSQADLCGPKLTGDSKGLLRGLGGDGLNGSRLKRFPR